MKRFTITGARILTDDCFVSNHALVVDDGVVEAIVPIADARGDLIALDGGDLLPGFIDVQVNGGGGVMFNDSTTVEGIATIGAVHRRFGTTGFLPTLISTDLEIVDSAIDAVDTAIETGVQGVLGIHLEGPFLNPVQRGIHDSTKFRALDNATIERITRLERGITLVTIAPELAPPGAIRALKARGAIVCAGHTAATYDQTRAALAEGLDGFTHLFNAMTRFDGREPGVVGAAIEDAASWCGVIVDGHHVHPASLRIVMAAKPGERLLLVTDAMSTVGAESRQFMLGDTQITANDGRLTGPDGTLAGSDLDMASAVRNAERMMGLTRAKAVALASAHPAAFLGISGQRGRIAPGLAADLVHVDDELRVLRSWIAGA